MTIDGTDRKGKHCPVLLPEADGSVDSHGSYDGDSLYISLTKALVEGQSFLSCFYLFLLPMKSKFFVHCHVCSGYLWMS